MIDREQFSAGINGIPQAKDRAAMWESLTISIAKQNTPALNEYVSHLKKYYINGCIKYGCFELGESETLDWYCARNKLQEMFFFKKIWEQEPIKSYFQINLVDDDADHQINWSSPFLLGGNLAWCLDSGGAYKQPSWGGAKSKDLGDKAALELIANDYQDSLVFQSDDRWCDFFYDVAWNYTWAVLNKQTRMLQVLLATDTD